MAITILNVPYSEKDEAKSKGARWDPQKKKWYVPDGIDLQLFKKWLPDPANKKRMIAPIFILESTAYCWKCEMLIKVITLTSNGFIDHNNETTADFIIYGEIIELPNQLEHYLNQHFPNFYIDYSKTVNTNYYMNHCICQAKQGNFFLHDEPGAPFFPTEPEHCKDKILYELIGLKTPVISILSYGMTSTDMIIKYSKHSKINL
jgi:hypothetical protein